jgi:hypothetical protein
MSLATRTRRLHALEAQLQPVVIPPVDIACQTRIYRGVAQAWQDGYLVTTADGYDASPELSYPEPHNTYRAMAVMLNIVSHITGQPLLPAPELAALPDPQFIQAVDRHYGGHILGARSKRHAP